MARIEIIYCLQDIPLFYTRSIQPYLEPLDTARLETILEKFQNDGIASFGFGDMLPETRLTLNRAKSSSTIRRIWGGLG